MLSIVFICTGNICRSPMAEGIFKYRVLNLGRLDIATSSMGIHGLDFKPASENAIRVCYDNGIDISSHLSRPLFSEELRYSDLIFVMEPVHKEFLKTFFPMVIDRVFLLGSWPGKDSSKGTVTDPIGGSYEQYKKTFGIIQSHIDRVTQYVLEMNSEAHY